MRGRHTEHGGQRVALVYGAARLVAGRQRHVPTADEDVGDIPSDLRQWRRSRRRRRRRRGGRRRGGGGADAATQLWSDCRYPSYRNKKQNKNRLACLN